MYSLVYLLVILWEPSRCVIKQTTFSPTQRRFHFN